MREKSLAKGALGSKAPLFIGKASSLTSIFSLEPVQFKDDYRRNLMNVWMLLGRQTDLVLVSVFG